MAINVTGVVPVYDIDGIDARGERGPVAVHSHRIYRDCVVLEIDDRRYTVVAADLEAAIRNATNTGS